MLDSGTSSAPEASPRAGTLLWIFAALFVAQSILYRDAFLVGPSGDDLNAPLADIWRGEADGPVALLMRSAQPHNYRPLQSLTMWAFGEISYEHRTFWIHIPHFIGMFVFAFAGWLWLRQAPVSRVAASCGALIMFVHPVLVAPLAGVDGFATLFSTGLMWISAFCVFIWRERLAYALPPALLTFALALGFKEYALGTVPLACLATLCFSRSFRRGLIRACIVGLAMSMIVLAFMAIRRVTVPPPAPGQDVSYLLFDPVTWIKNAAMFAGVLLFPGSTKWVFVNRSPYVVAISASAILVCGLMLVFGLFCRWIAFRSKGGLPSKTSESAWTWTIFSVLGLAGASFPAILVFHVSEMYVAGMLIPLAILVALAADGFRTRTSGARTAGWLIFVAATIWSALSVRAKIADLRRMGELTESMLRDIMAMLPADASDLTIAACFPDEPARTRHYSVFDAPPRLLIEQPQALWWINPHKNLNMAFPQPTFAQTLADLGAYDVIVQWNSDERRLHLVRSNLLDSSSNRTTEK